MKKFAGFVAVIVVAVLAIPVIQYRTLSPCGMVKQEWVKHMRERTEELSAQGREEASRYGEDAERIADGIGAIVENVAEDVAERVAEARVEDMSVGQCVKELWRIKTGEEPDLTDW